MRFAHSLDVKGSRSFPTGLHVASSDRSSAFRSNVFSLAKTCSIGFRSGPLGGRMIRWAFAFLIALRTAFPLAALIVQDHDVSRVQGRDQGLLDMGLLDMGLEPCRIDGLIEDDWRSDPIVPNGGDEGHAFPVAVRDLADQALAPGRAAVGAGHVGLGPGFVDEHQTPRIKPCRWRSRWRRSWAVAQPLAQQHADGVVRSGFPPAADALAPANRSPGRRP